MKNNLSTIHRTTLDNTLKHPRYTVDQNHQTIEKHHRKNHGITIDKLKNNHRKAIETPLNKPWVAFGNSTNPSENNQPIPLKKTYEHSQ